MRHTSLVVPTRTVRALAETLGITPGELATPEEVAEADKGSHASTNLA